MPFDDITEKDIQIPANIREAVSDKLAELHCAGLRAAQRLVEEDKKASAHSLIHAMRADPKLASLEGRTLVLLVRILRRHANPTTPTPVALRPVV